MMHFTRSWSSMLTAIALTAVLMSPVAYAEKVPNVVGSSIDAARTKLKVAGFQCVIKTTVKVTQENIDPTTVREQAPRGGSDLRRGTVVTLLVFKTDNRTVTVPNFVGQAQDAASASINSLGLRPQVTKVANTDSRLAGKILSQKPVSGTELPIHSRVDIFVAFKPRTYKVHVPNVIGLKLDNARSDLAAGGFICVVDSAVRMEKPSLGGRRPPPVRAGVVQSQTPGAGTALDYGSVVTVYAP